MTMAELEDRVRELEQVVRKAQDQIEYYYNSTYASPESTLSEIDHILCEAKVQKTL